MIDTGKSLRMNLLEESFKRQALFLLENHGWYSEIEKREENGEYLLIKLQKSSVIKKVALLYSQSTAKDVYKRIESEADACLINGLDFDPNNFFSKEFKKPIMLLNEILEIIKDWNHEAQSPANDDSVKCPNNKLFDNMVLTAETPSEQMWMMLKMLRSVEVSKKIITERFPDESINTIEEKANGISFLMQNACDYFEAAPTQNLTQRLLSLYYGTLAFIEAEILVTSKEYINLKTVESITKNGHGLYTILPTDNYSLDALCTGILGKGKGLFPAWLEVRGLDTDVFPTKKVKNEINDYCYTLNALLNRIPEISALMRIIDSDYKPGFLLPVYDLISNQSGNSLFKNNGGYKSNTKGTYINLYDYSGCCNIEMVKLILGPLEQHKEFIDKDKYLAYKVFVNQAGQSKGEHWYHYLNIHKSTFCENSIIIPLKGLGDDWEIYAVMILYTFSIIVRYYPNLWRRIQYGEWDKYYVVCEQFAQISEKVLPYIFFEKISGQKLYVRQSGSFL